MPVGLSGHRVGFRRPPANRSRRVHDGVLAPQQPAGVTRGTWFQTMPGKGVVRRSRRLYSPLEPFFDKSWRPSEIQVVR